jgi:hypothetical protein
MRGVFGLAPLFPGGPGGTKPLGLYGGVLWSGEFQGSILHELVPKEGPGPGPGNLEPEPSQQGAGRIALKNQ